MISTTAFMFYLSTHYRPVSEEEFLEFREEVNSRFNDLTADHDTIKAELDSLMESMGGVMESIDSLHAGQQRIFKGQSIIYGEVRKQASADTHFWDTWF